MVDGLPSEASNRPGRPGNAQQGEDEMMTELMGLGALVNSVKSGGVAAEQENS
jgi:hypothetical protein